MLRFNNYLLILVFCYCCNKLIFVLVAQNSVAQNCKNLWCHTLIDQKFRWTWLLLLLRTSQGQNLCISSHLFGDYLEWIWRIHFQTHLRWHNTVLCSCRPKVPLFMLSAGPQFQHLKIICILCHVIFSIFEPAIMSSHASNPSAFLLWCMASTSNWKRSLLFRVYVIRVMWYGPS